MSADAVTHTHANSYAHNTPRCDRHGIEFVDDLLGGGVDMGADQALWEDFLSALRLGSPVHTNRIRRELVARYGYDLTTFALALILPGRTSRSRTVPGPPCPLFPDLTPPPYLSNTPLYPCHFVLSLDAQAKAVGRTAKCSED